MTASACRQHAYVSTKAGAVSGLILRQRDLQLPARGCPGARPGQSLTFRGSWTASPRQPRDGRRHPPSGGGRGQTLTATSTLLTRSRRNQWGDQGTGYFWSLFCQAQGQGHLHDSILTSLYDFYASQMSCSWPSLDFEIDSKNMAI